MLIWCNTLRIHLKFFWKFKSSKLGVLVVPSSVILQTQTWALTLVLRQVNLVSYRRNMKNNFKNLRTMSDSILEPNNNSVCTSRAWLRKMKNWKPKFHRVNSNTKKSSLKSREKRGDWMSFWLSEKAKWRRVTRRWKYILAVFINLRSKSRIGRKGTSIRRGSLRSISLSLLWTSIRI